MTIRELRKALERYNQAANVFIVTVSPVHGDLILEPVRKVEPHQGSNPSLPVAAKIL